MSVTITFREIETTVYSGLTVDECTYGGQGSSRAEAAQNVTAAWFADDRSRKYRRRFSAFYLAQKMLRDHIQQLNSDAKVPPLIIGNETIFDRLDVANAALRCLNVEEFEGFVHGLTGAGCGPELLEAGHLLDDWLNGRLS